MSIVRELHEHGYLFRGHDLEAAITDLQLEPTIENMQKLNGEFVRALGALGYLQPKETAKG